MKTRPAAEMVPPASGQIQIPYYDDIVLKQELELKAVIGPIQSKISYTH